MSGLPHNARPFNERIAIAGAYGRGKTFREVGEEYGITDGRAQQIWGKEFRIWHTRSEYRSHTWTPADVWAETEVVRRVWEGGYPTEIEERLERKSRTRKSQAKPWTAPPPAPTWRTREAGMVGIGNGEVDPGYKEKMDITARTLDLQFNGDVNPGDRHVGFVLMVFGLDGVSPCNYISNGADGDDIIQLMETQLKKLKEWRRG